MSFGGCNCTDNKPFFYKEKESAQLKCFDFSFNHTHANLITKPVAVLWNVLCRQTVHRLNSLSVNTISSTYLQKEQVGLSVGDYLP